MVLPKMRPPHSNRCDENSLKPNTLACECLIVGMCSRCHCVKNSGRVRRKREKKGKRGSEELLSLIAHKSNLTVFLFQKWLDWEFTSPLTLAHTRTFIYFDWINLVYEFKMAEYSVRKDTAQKHTDTHTHTTFFFYSLRLFEGEIIFGARVRA